MKPVRGFPDETSQRSLSLQMPLRNIPRGFARPLRGFLAPKGLAEAPQPLIDSQTLLKWLLKAAQMALRGFLAHGRRWVLSTGGGWTHPSGSVCVGARITPGLGQRNMRAAWTETTKGFPAP